MSESETTVDALPPEHFVPEATRENYDQIARDRASVTGNTPKQELAELRKQWLEQHKKDPQAGYNHLAEWAKGRDPGDGTTDAASEAKSRAIESVRRDPLASVGGFAGDPDVQKALKERYDAEGTEQVSPSTGSIPNPGPAPIDAGSSSGS
ncbi:hypothetical protein [Angustibacter luteus]|uniref:Uncharacterized protein n=1 Tax=Angustibacter luteus TaxID=658456 RepID=A0ABW1JKA1_9ACTN